MAVAVGRDAADAADEAARTGIFAGHGEGILAVETGVRETATGRRGCDRSAAATGGEKAGYKQRSKRNKRLHATPSELPADFSARCATQGISRTEELIKELRMIPSSE